MSFFPIQIFNKKKPVKIFGIGTLKTGTTSLGAALKALGLKHTHSHRNYLLKQVKKGDFEEVFRWVDRYESFEDWPWPLIYRELNARYPDSRFILTTRTNEKVWLRSMIRHAESCGPTRGRKLFFGYGMPHQHEAEYIACYNRHNQQVRGYFQDQPGKLLEVCWEEGDGWTELCSFLDLPQPDVPFPKINTATHRVNK